GAVRVATGNTPLAGESEGVDAILGHYGQLFELSDGTFTATLESLTVEGDDTVAATHRDKAERGDKTPDQDETLTFTISGGASSSGSSRAARTKRRTTRSGRSRPARSPRSRGGTSWCGADCVLMASTARQRDSRP